MVHSATFYLDESGFHEGSPAMAVGGYLAGDGHWKVFGTKWRAVLDDEGLKHMHMADLESLKGAYVGWTQGRKVDFLSKVIPIINEHAGAGVACGIAAEDYRSLVPRHLATTPQEWLELAFIVCFARCLTELATPLAQHNNIQVRLIFDRNPAMAPLIKGALEKVPHPGLGKITFEDKQEYFGLQAADMLVYETFKSIDNRFGLVKRPTRKSLQALDAGRPKLMFLERDVLKDDLGLFFSFWPDGRRG